MDKQRFTLAVLTLVPLVVACGSQKAGSGSGSVDVRRPVTGVDWRVHDITAGGTTTKARGKPYLAFDAKSGKVGGSGATPSTRRPPSVPRRSRSAAPPPPE